MILLTRAIWRIPPKMTHRVSNVNTTPVIAGSKPKAPSQAAQMVLLCTELNAKPNVTEISTAKQNPIQRRPNPCCM